ncbi:MAG: 1-acyl-sn-glycerol-3-phosphate acyltransferase [Tannerella sp.]|nr:1-acyl-sn-glycerol-3-phosphate acyltransferase [Tannerella sp.]
MKKNLCKFILHVTGWKIGYDGGSVRKSVICVAPHTSNWDFLIGKLFYNAIGRKSKFLIKKEWFVFPFNFIFGSMGGIPVNREKSSSTTERLAKEFLRYDTFHLAITPEGTRKKTSEWKKGFYYIALKAKVPIQVAYIDYAKKEAGIKANFHPTGNVEDDIMTIRAMYEGVKGFHKKNFIE